MKKIKAILSDFDGTLVNVNSQYSPEIIPLIKKIQNQGIRFSLATGRAYYSAIKRIEGELGIQGIHILHGGAMIFDSINNKILFQNEISSDSTKKIMEYLLNHRLIFSLEEKDHVYVSEFVKGSKHYPDMVNQSLKERKNDEQTLKMVIYAKANHLNEKEFDQHVDKLEKICSDVAIMKFNIENFFGADITSEKSTKHTAVLEYLKILGLTKDEVIAIGDGPNDYPLFTACGFGIAMASAPQELKEIAGLVVPSVSDGGMVEALKYICG